MTGGSRLGFAAIEVLIHFSNLDFGLRLIEPTLGKSFLDGNSCLELGRKISLSLKEFNLLHDPFEIFSLELFDGLAAVFVEDECHKGVLRQGRAVTQRWASCSLTWLSKSP